MSGHVPTLTLAVVSHLLSQSSDVWSHNPLCCFSTGVLFCLHANMIFYFLLAALKDQCINDKLCFKLRKRAQKMHAKKPGFTVDPKIKNRCPLTWIAHPLHTQRKWGQSGQTPRACSWSFSTVRHCSSEICSFRSKGSPAISLGRFAISATASLPRTTRIMMVEPGQNNWPMCQCTLFHQHRNFWLLKTWLWSLALLTSLIWLFCFWEWNHSYMGTSSRMSETQEELLEPLHNSEGDYSEREITTSNKCKHIFQH
jgi:hypothetical protein